MAQEKRMVVANWKMNPTTLKEAAHSATRVRAVAARTRNTETVVCPPFVYLAPLASRAGGKKFSLGAQNCFWEREGAYTGEIAPAMLADLGVRYVLAGHSERRARGETNKIVNRKVCAALVAGIAPILCVGERERDPEGMYLALIREQVTECLKNVPPRSVPKFVIAYEPVFTIGKSAARALSPTDVQEMSLYIRKVLRDIFSPAAAQSVPILYGGSVAPENAGGIVAEGAVQGLLVGHQSLDPASFSEIIRAVDKGKA